MCELDCDDPYCPSNRNEIKQTKDKNTLSGTIESNIKSKFKDLQLKNNNVMNIKKLSESKNECNLKNKVEKNQRKKIN